MPVPRLARAVGALVLAAGLTAGCGSGSDEPSAPTGATRVFTADNGDITIPAAPKRVIATGYAVPALLEAGAPLVGISTWRRGLPMMTPQTRAAYDTLAKVAGESAAETNYEAIAQAEPDLIVIGVPKPVLADIELERLRAIAPVVALGPSLPSGWRELSRRQADAAGALATFDTVRDAYRNKTRGIAAKYAGVLPRLRCAHLGAYGEIANGNFQREFNGSWGTNVAQDLGADYYGQVKVKGGGSKEVSEYPSIEELPSAFGEAEVITYTIAADGSTPGGVRYVLDSPLWKGLSAVKAGRVYPLRYTEATTYGSAMATADAVDKALEPLLNS
ncbi:ABC transporter substrate-binding protein [Actinokineospora globicatena]|uniref:ABC transporter substrate-binding protein n=1 Tax=Actinokineospora globicatena TaxID=103729 RepID=UPI0020A5B681|nr:ABC transporter substrate-binding protein [Actinokineospora globicatena]MCP2303723.1 iron complex transport system substrate-binding protein [Actinokineospora globicatena]GLW79129.1 hypothetical protein Aglo01_36110 [Actinokineospora globicatena]GLW86461.1 hypothetical protein Aglo02_41000 [Actinokineospora globicatena]